MFQSPIAHRFFGVLALASLGTTCAPRFAQGAPLTEETFLEGLDASHPAVVALTQPLVRAEAERRRAGVWSNPTFEFEYEAPGDDADQSTFKVDWQPPLDGRRGLAVDAGVARVDAARSEFDAARLALRERARGAFAEWAVARRRLDLVTEHHEAMRTLQDRLNVRAERGEESKLAARRFALAVIELRAELAHAEADLAIARGNALALREDLTTDAVPVLPEPPRVLPSMAEFVRPDVEARRHEVQAAQFDRRLAGRVLEFPSLVLGWTRVTAAEEDATGPYLGLAWDVPLFDRNQGDRQEASRSVAIAEARLRLAEREAAARRSAAFTAYSSLHATLLEVNAVTRAAPETARAASASFLAGESGMTDLLETLRSVLQSQLVALELQAEVLAAHRELEWSVGHVLTGGDDR